jgi:hypothetical protein
MKSEKVTAGRAKILVQRRKGRKWESGESKRCGGFITANYEVRVERFFLIQRKKEELSPISLRKQAGNPTSG